MSYICQYKDDSVLSSKDDIYHVQLINIKVLKNEGEVLKKKKKGSSRRAFLKSWS